MRALNLIFFLTLSFDAYSIDPIIIDGREEQWLEEQRPVRNQRKEAILAETDLAYQNLIDEVSKDLKLELNIDEKFVLFNMIREAEAAYRTSKKTLRTALTSLETIQKRNILGAVQFVYEMNVDRIPGSRLAEVQSKSPVQYNRFVETLHKKFGSRSHNPIPDKLSLSDPRIYNGLDYVPFGGSCRIFI